jgi:folate-binding protein YgfZ
MANLKEIQRQAGAIFTEPEAIPTSFGHEREALRAAREKVAICDRSNWGLIEVTGDDRLPFLHNQTTNDLNKLQPGQGCDTVFVTSTARTIDLVTAYVQEERVLLLVSPSRRQKLLEWMDRYIFPPDKVKLWDLSADYAIFTLIGLASQELLSQWVSAEILSQAEGSNQMVAIDGFQVILGVGSGLALPGYNLIMPGEKAGEIWEKLTAKDVLPMGSQAWEKLRILQGRPKPEAELTEDYNPLEAGLWPVISFDKGCYIGQETIARLNTYKGVKQRLWGIQLNQAVTPGATVTGAGEKIGVITSYTDTETGGFALAYIRTLAGGVGLKVEIGEATGEVAALPFVRHEYYQP